MSSFFDDYADVFNSEPTPMTHCDLDAIRREREAFRRDVLEPLQAGKYTPRKFPLPTDDKGTSQPVKPPDKRKRAPKGKVNRTPPAVPAVTP